MPSGLRAVMQQLLDEILGDERQWRIFPESSEGFIVPTEEVPVHENSVANLRNISQEFGGCSVREIMLVNSFDGVIREFSSSRNVRRTR